MGVHGVDVNLMIDIDEVQFKLESQDRRYGKEVKELSCNTTGMYIKGAGSVSLLLAISRDADVPFEFHRTYAEELMMMTVMVRMLTIPLMMMSTT